MHIWQWASLSPSKPFGSSNAADPCITTTFMSMDDYNDDEQWAYERYLGGGMHARGQRLRSWHGSCAALLRLAGRQPALRCRRPAQEAQICRAAPACAIFKAAQGPLAEPILPDAELPELQLQVGRSGGIVCGGRGAQATGGGSPETAWSGALEDGVGQGGPHRSGNSGVQLHARGRAVEGGFPRCSGGGTLPLCFIRPAVKRGQEGVARRAAELGSGGKLGSGRRTGEARG